MLCSSDLGCSLCFWPFFPLFGFPWPNLPFLNTEQHPLLASAVPEAPCLPFPFSFSPNSLFFHVYPTRFVVCGQSLFCYK
ncbi:hypothetical protein KSP39_PZI013398 [Platanthera zijinensis]|uniref:Uncharacterized protein n=1 Tax=Platanthera zijinensis TaxID=2320716 RepID=A0AAP0BBW8_9ASPA